MRLRLEYGITLKNMKCDFTRICPKYNKDELLQTQVTRHAENREYARPLNTKLNAGRSPYNSATSNLLKHFSSVQQKSRSSSDCSFSIILCSSYQSNCKIIYYLISEKGLVHLPLGIAATKNMHNYIIIGNLKNIHNKHSGMDS